MPNFSSLPKFKIINIGISSEDAENVSVSDIHPDPVFEIINSIYTGFRQCYSPGIPDQTLKKYSDSDELLEKYMKTLDQASYRNTAKVWKQSLLSLDDHELRLKDMLHKAAFISQHMNHISQLEHGIITINVQQISRAASMQFVRHRMATYGVQSQRYVDWNKKDMGSITIPPKIANNPEAKDVFLECINHIEDAIQKLTDLGINREDIRYIYPEGTDTYQVATMNLHSWIHFIEERLCSRAQWEIRAIARKLLKVFQIMFPFIFDDVGPKCYRLRYCPEHGGCDIHNRVIAKYGP